MILVDFETTGLPNANPNPEAQPGIMQFGLIELTDNWDIIEEHQGLVNPEKVCEPEAFKAHKITDERVRNEPTLPARLPELAAIFRRHDCWVGYNNPFDREVLWHQLLRYNWGQRFPWPSRDIDIMVVGSDITNMAGKQGVKRPKLIELHTHLFGTGFSDAHDALEDCRATARCGKALMEKGYL